MADTERMGRHRQALRDGLRSPVRPRARLVTMIAAVAVAVTMAAVAVYAAHSLTHPAAAGSPALQVGRNDLPTAPGSYIGVYPRGAPDSFAGVTAFATTTGINPGVIVYDSWWLEPFRVRFATSAADDGAVSLVQMDPQGVSIAEIAAGKYDSYLGAYAEAVRLYGHPVILSFGHEMNGYWFSWGYQQTSPAVFVAAWRHIVTLFRTLDAQNVTWLWTINTIHKQAGVRSPGPWWPGKSYVTWVGIDGYYVNPSSEFASVFGPTIAAVRMLTREPILIAETAATPAADQPAKIANLFAGIRTYRLLGFVWFDSVNRLDWRLTSPAAIAAFRRGAQAYDRPAS